MSVVRFFQTLRGPDVFVVDANKTYNICIEQFGVLGTPAVLVFFRGFPVRILREGWEEDMKCKIYPDVGVTSHQNFAKLLKTARDTAHSGLIVCD